MWIRWATALMRTLNLENRSKRAASRMPLQTLVMLLDTSGRISGSEIGSTRSCISLGLSASEECFWRKSGPVSQVVVLRSQAGVDLDP